MCSMARERGGSNEGQQRVCEARGRRGISSPRRASCRIFHFRDSYVERWLRFGGGACGRRS